MLHELLTFIEKRLNNHLKLKLGISDNKVILTTLSTSSGGPSAMLNDTVVMSLVNIQEEKTHNPRHQYVRTSGGFSQMKPPVSLNVYVIFAAYYNHENYSVIGFFQVNNLFQSEEYPALARISNKVSAELVSMDISQLNQLWGPLTSNYKPSALYRFRSVIIQESELKDDIAPIKSVN
jgi:hypothetical protein